MNMSISWGMEKEICLKKLLLKETTELELRGICRVIWIANALESS